MDTREEVVENLALADQCMKKMFPTIGKVKLILVGGAAIILKGFENKMTMDIDTVTKLEDEVSEFLEDFAINSQASGVSVLPEGYESRMEFLDLGLEVLEVYLVSNEDLVISKVGRYSYDDKRDLEDTGLLDNVDNNKLVCVGDRVCASDSSFRNNWESFKKLSLFG